MSGVALREVTPDEAEIRLDRWLRRHYPTLTQGVIQRLCRTGQVRVDGGRVEAATRLVAGQSVRIPPIPAAARPPAPAVDPRILAELERMVLYRDDQLIVLDKPAGLPTQGGPGITRHLDGMLAQWPERPRLVHRLDRDTSGVLVVARTPGVAARLAAAFRSRAVDKTYWAVVVGRPVPVAGRKAGRGWCTGLIATLRECWWWRLRPAWQPNSPPRSAPGRSRRPTGRWWSAGRCRWRAGLICRWCVTSRASAARASPRQRRGSARPRGR